MHAIPGGTRDRHQRAQPLSPSLWLIRTICSSSARCMGFIRDPGAGESTSDAYALAPVLVLDHCHRHAISPTLATPSSVKVLGSGSTKATMISNAPRTARFAPRSQFKNAMGVCAGRNRSTATTLEREADESDPRANPLPDCRLLGPRRGLTFRFALARSVLQSRTDFRTYACARYQFAGSTSPLPRISNFVGFWR
jgi:hypothetical protein